MRVPLFKFFLIWAKGTKFFLPQFGQANSAPLAILNYMGEVAQVRDN
jgi:hypothetical protein